VIDIEQPKKRANMYKRNIDSLTGKDIDEERFLEGQETATPLHERENKGSKHRKNEDSTVDLKEYRDSIVEN
jgi:hypothetical protein